VFSRFPPHFRIWNSGGKTGQENHEYAIEMMDHFLHGFFTEKRQEYLPTQKENTLLICVYSKNYSEPSFLIAKRFSNRSANKKLFS